MPHRDDYRVSDIPNKPGCYVFRDRFGEVIYVGKAKSLRKRLSNYFQPSRKRTADPKLRSLIHSIDSYELMPVRTEDEALLLEDRLIKQYDPRFNILLRDDKRFLLIKIDMHAPFPRLELARLRKDDGYAYFGPFPVATALRETAAYLTQRFGLRSCKARVPGELERRHCLDDIVRNCSAPCELRVDEKAYHAQVHELIRVIEGDVDGLIDETKLKMAEYAEKQNYEMAARLRDIAENLSSVFGKRNRTFVRSSGLASYPGMDGVQELQAVLELEQPPRTMECFDISNIQGVLSVGAMTVFVDGQPSRRDYRHFRIKEVEGPDDFASMQEVVRRRYSRLLAEKKPLPDLIVIDGGKGQLHAAWDALAALDLPSLPVIGLAKKQEEIFTIYSSEPIVLDHHRPALRMLQAIRDEAHRFGITFHRELRRKRIIDSMLDEIPGIGKNRRNEILKAFGSVTNLRRHDATELAKRVPGIGPILADQIMSHIKKRPAAPDPD